MVAGRWEIVGSEGGVGSAADRLSDGDTTGDSGSGDGLGEEVGPVGSGWPGDVEVGGSAVGVRVGDGDGELGDAVVPVVGDVEAARPARPRFENERGAVGFCCAEW